MTATTATATTRTTRPRRGRALLVPLATLVAAAGIAFASGATFNTATASTGLVASGSLNQTNSNSIAFERANLKPGDVVTGEVTITNNSTLPATLSITEKAPAAGEITFDPQYLTLDVREPGATTPLYSGPLGSAGEFGKSLDLDANGARTFTYTITFAQSAPNTQQAKVARTTYTFITVQKDAETFEDTQWGTVQDTKPASQGTPEPVRAADATAPAPATPVIPEGTTITPAE